MNRPYTEQTEAHTIVGLELRTHNGEAFTTIPAHWARFAGSGVMARLTDKWSEDIHAVYTHFENAGRSNQGLYSLVIGARVPADAPVPEGCVRVVVPASLRAVFRVARGRTDLVGAAWQSIWARKGLCQTFIADYERYRPTGEIDILIGVERASACSP